MQLKAVINYLQGYKKITVGLVIVILVGGYGIYRLNQPQNNPVQETFAQTQVTRGTMEVTVTGTGTIAPAAVQDISATQAGTVKKVYVNNNDQINKGDLLMEIESDSLELEVEKARLDLEKARLSLQDTLKQLSSDTITASISGRVSSLDIKQGDEVSRNSVLLIIQNDTQLVFEMPIAGSYAEEASVGHKVEVFLPDKGEIIEGTVISKSNQSASGYNGGSRSYLKVGVDATGNLAPGTKAFGTIVLDGKQVDALAVSTLEWIGEAQVKATLQGEITALFVQEGQVVSKGQNLLKIESETTSTQQTQQLSYDQARLNLTNLENKLSDLKIAAPINGVITGMDIAAGDEVGTSLNQGSASGTAAASAKSLGKIIDKGQMEVSFLVDEVDIAKVKVGQEAELTADAIPDKTFQGKVAAVAEEGTVENNVSSFEVTILVDNQEDLLKSGMTANVTITTAKKDNALLIPIEALQERGQGKMVFIPTSGDSEQRQNVKQVKVGLINETYAEIIEGLQEGEAIVIPMQLNNNANSNQRSMMPGLGGGALGGGRMPSGGGRIPSGGVRISPGAGPQGGGR